MPRDNLNSGNPIFDIRPVNQSGVVDAVKMAGISRMLDLKKPALPDTRTASQRLPAKKKPFSRPGAAEDTNAKHQVLREFQEALHGNFDLSSFGADSGDAPSRARYRVPPIKKRSEDSYHREIISLINHRQIGSETGSPDETSLDETEADPIPDFDRLNPERAPESAGEAEVQAQIANYYLNPSARPVAASVGAAFKKITGIFNGRNKKLIILFLILAIGYAGKHTYDIKKDVVRAGESAVQKLAAAGDNIKSGNFKEASGNFAQAYAQFSKASEDLSFIGSGIGSILETLPGGNKITSAKNIITTGKLISEAGKSMADAITAISRTGSILNPSYDVRAMNADIISKLKESLSLADINLDQAGTLIRDIDENDIPSDKRDQFLSLKEKLPALIEIVKSGSSYADFLETLVGTGAAKRYLVLFQNYSELRPIGGFPGSYGIVTFENGSLKDIVVDDVYNLDGQLKQNIIPPKPLQHITPTWGMRDAGWFADFPSSAQKALSFYKMESGQDADGVITLSPKVLMAILDIVGPVQLPEYGMELSGGNFLSQVQEEVEYGDNRQQPKTVLVDFAPKFLQKLYTSDRSKWLDVFNVLVAGMERKDILLYFKDLKLETFAVQNNFSGDVKNPGGDYLMVNVANVKGSKADAVTDTSLRVTTVLKDGAVRHRLSITRKHNGGSSQFGFYNKQNPAYVRVLAPEGSRLESISGNTQVSFSPLVDYGGADFIRDSDLAALESSGKDAGGGANQFSESGKTEFAFWMVLNPGDTKTVELVYTVPIASDSDYKLYVQKQPGLEVSNFEFVLDKPDNRLIASAEPILSQIGSIYTLNTALNKDLALKISFK